MPCTCTSRYIRIGLIAAAMLSEPEPEPAPKPVAAPASGCRWVQLFGGAMTSQVGTRFADVASFRQVTEREKEASGGSGVSWTPWAFFYTPRYHLYGVF